VSEIDGLVDKLKDYTLPMEDSELNSE